MMDGGSLRLTYYDKILIGGIIVVILGSFVWFAQIPLDQEGVIEIETVGRRKQTVDIQREQGVTISVEGAIGYSLLEIGENRVKMADSACRDKICVHTGWIGRSGQQIVCLPNQVVVRFRSKKPDVDGING